MILDINLGSINGFEILERLRKDPSFVSLPVIIYTGKDLTPKEEETLKKYSESIIIKGLHSSERLLDETTLFLHRVNQNGKPSNTDTAANSVNDENIGELKGKKVLLVDDDLRNIFALTHVLEDQQMKVVIAKNGKEALEQIKNNQNTDIVLMDIMMPEMDGYEAIREIRKLEAFKSTPILALTAKAMKGDKQKTIEAGANDYLAKPINHDNLLSQMRVWTSN